jgi:ABC-type antimicrobial peptide transport system permease subunit
MRRHTAFYVDAVRIAVQSIVAHKLRVFLTLVGTIVGRMVMVLLPELPASIPPWAVATDLLVRIGVGFASGVWPARKAAALDPVEALSYD